MSTAAAHWRDTAGLAATAYRDGRGLAARARLYDHLGPRTDLHEYVADAFPVTDGAVLVDLGCGTAPCARRWAERGATAVGVDASLGMLVAARALSGAPRYAVGDANTLPLAKRSVDGIAAVHVLYHLGTLDAVLTGWARALKPAGMLVATVNGPADKAELHEVRALAMRDAVGDERPYVPLDRRWSRETLVGALHDVFGEVSRTTLTATIEAPSADVVVDYVASTRATDRRLDDAEWERYLAALRSRVHAQVVTAGTMSIQSEIDVYAASAPRTGSDGS